MGFTAFSFIVLPLCMLWFWKPAKLLKLVLFAGIFEAAAAFSIGSLGVQPGLVPALAFIVFMLFQMLFKARFTAQTQIWHALAPLLIVGVWAVGTSFVMPLLFVGKVFVWPQKLDGPLTIRPLVWNSGNLNQDLYLIIDLLFVALAGVFLRGQQYLRTFVQIYLSSGLLVAAVAFWQFGNRVAGVPYPSSLFYSNPGVAILTEQTMGALPRINGPFTEPAALAEFMLAIVCATGWALIQGHRGRLIGWLFALGLLTIFVSTSATGIAGLAIVATALPIFALLTGSMRLLGSVVRIGAPLIVAIGLLFACGTVLIPGFANIVGTVIDSTVTKQDSSSYEDRTGVDRDSMIAAVDSYGLGVGWGSNRSSSLVPGLLANIGLPGVFGLLWFGFVMTGRVRKARRGACSAEERLVIDICCGSLIGYVLGACLSGPSIVSTTFYFLLALLTACVTRVSSRTQLQYWLRQSSRAGVGPPKEDGTDDGQVRVL